MMGWQRARVQKAKPRPLDAPCPICGFGMLPPHVARLVGAPSAAATYDHIMPRTAGGSDHPDNLTLVCALCNQTRAATGHCIGAMACVRAVLGRKRPTVGEASRLWVAWRKVSARAKAP